MKKKTIALITLLIFIITNTCVFAKNSTDKNDNGINIAPEVDFSISAKKNIDILVVTDYTGAKLADLQNRLTDTKTLGLANGADIKYGVFGDNAKIGTQQSKIDITCYGRALYFSYIQNNYSGYQAPAILNKQDRINYEYCELEPGQSLPPLVKGDPVYYDNSYTDYQGMGWCMIGRKITFYNPSNYSATRTEMTLTEQWSNGWDSGPSGYYARSYSNFSLVSTNYWSYSSTYQRDVTGDIKAFDFTKLNKSFFRTGSSRYVLLLTDSTDTVSYNKAFGSYYPFASLKSSNLGTYIKDNNAHAYAICNNSIADIKMSDYNPYKISYTDGSLQQDKSIREIVNSSKDARVYGQGQIQNALNTISGNISKPENTNIDMIIATDQGASVPNTFINKLKSRLDTSVDLDTTVIDNSGKVQIDTLQRPGFKNIKKNVNFGVAGGQSCLVLDNDGNLFAKGNNFVSGYYSYGSYYQIGIFGNNTIESYANFTSIQTNVKDFELIKYVNNSDGTSFTFCMLVVIKNDGTVWATGSNFSGIISPWVRDQYNQILNSYYTSFIQLSGLSNIKQALVLKPQDTAYEGYWRVEYVSMLMVFLTNNGNVYYKGSDSSNCLHYDPTYSTPNFTTPYLDPSLSNITAINGFVDNSYITLLAGTSSGSIYVKGRDYNVNPNQTDYWHTYNSSFYYLFNVSGRGSVDNIYYTYNASSRIFVKFSNKDLYVYNKFADGYNGIGSDTIIPTTPRLVLSNVNTFNFTSYYSIFYIITTTGDLYYWGYNYYMPYGFMGYQPTTSYVINLPAKCQQINNVDSIYSDSFYMNQPIYYKKTDGTWYYSGSPYGYNIYDTDPAKQNSTAYSSTMTPIKLNPSASLKISDFIYLNGYGFLALDLSGNMFKGSTTYV